MAARRSGPRLRLAGLPLAVACIVSLSGGDVFVDSLEHGGDTETSNRLSNSNRNHLRHKRQLRTVEERAGGGDESVVVPRIVDGTTASLGKYPFYAAVVSAGWFGFADKLVCGGTLIADNLILSAGHCIESGSYINKVRVGAYTSTSSYGNGGQRYQDRDIEGYVRHPDYSSRTMNNDFIIFKLSTPVDDPYLLNSIIDLDINDKIRLEDGDALTAVGLGFLDDDYGQDKLPTTLQEVDLKYLSTWRCRSAGWPLLRSSMMCAIDPNPNDFRDQDSCQGRFDCGLSLVLVMSFCVAFCASSNRANTHSSL